MSSEISQGTSLQVALFAKTLGVDGARQQLKKTLPNTRYHGWNDVVVGSFSIVFDVCQDHNFRNIRVSTLRKGQEFLFNIFKRKRNAST